MKVQIIANAPTSYQFNSLRALAGSLPTSATPYGTYELHAIFETRAEAMQHLRDRAYKLYDDPTELREAIAEINRYGMLTYDCLTARIERVASPFINASNFHQ